MQIKIDSNLDQLARKFAAQAKQVQFAAAVALTRTAQDVQREVPAELTRVLRDDTATWAKIIKSAGIPIN